MDPALILCDLGGVVVHVDADRLVHHAAQLVGRPFDEVQRIVYHDDLLLPLELGRIEPRVYYEGLRNTLGLSWTYEQFARNWNDIFSENTGTTRIMRRLRERHKIFALSNTNALHISYIRDQMPGLSIFDAWIASCEVGLRKPDPAIYHLALERGGVEPSGAVYIDDRPELVEAGRRVGLQAIRFQSSQQLEQDLRALGLDL